MSIVQLKHNTNIFKTGPVNEHEKLSVHSLVVGPVVEPWSNR